MPDTFDLKCRYVQGNPTSFTLPKSATNMDLAVNRTLRRMQHTQRSRSAYKPSVAEGMEEVLMGWVHRFSEKIPQGEAELEP